MNDNGAADDAAPDAAVAVTDAAPSASGGDDAAEHRMQPDWDAIQRAYYSPTPPVAKVCERYGITHSQLYWRKRRYNWMSRWEALRRKAAEAGASSMPGVRAPIPSTTGGVRTWRRDMIVRLCEAMDRQLADIERQQRVVADTSTAERERQMRQMNAMARSIRQLTEFHEHEAERGDSAKRAKKNTGHRDPEAWRLEIAERIARIREKWLAEEAARKR